MKKFTKLSLKDISVEDAHGGTGKRQMLVKPEHVMSSHWEAVTKGFLSAGSIFDWHDHKDTDELFIVLKGKGKFYCEKEVVDYGIDDVIITPANLMHKIEADEDSEYYFIRITV